MLGQREITIMEALRCEDEKQKRCFRSVRQTRAEPQLCPLTGCVTFDRSLHCHHLKSGGQGNNSCAQNWVFPLW